MQCVSGTILARTRITLTWRTYAALRNRGSPASLLGAVQQKPEATFQREAVAQP
jgi:hypothetical protein